MLDRRNVLTSHLLMVLLVCLEILLMVLLLCLEILVLCFLLNVLFNSCLSIRIHIQNPISEFLQL